MLKHLLSIPLFAFSFLAQSAPQSIQVLDSYGKGVANVVVYLEPQMLNAPVVAKKTAIMDQIDTQFVPHILAVQKNTLVQFPNSDSIKHHVYSFSPAKTFELQLYKDLQADPLLFSKTGVVELGCNVHDWMLGYVYIVDTPYFSKTDMEGKVSLDLPVGDYVIKVWSPLIQDDIEKLSKNVTIKNKKGQLVVKLNKKLLPNLYQYEQLDEFSDYE
ncbi:methylamine utilization protein [Paraglaciecola sp.]|uniref:methylamine utilization protein n=1 Tax=Paraglaciecola sp. TaxID=1920173 RepID=UPI003EF8F443